MTAMYTVDGVLRFAGEDAFDTAVKAFRAAGLLTEDGRFRTQEDASPQTTAGASDIDRDDLVIDIPYNTYKDFFDVESDTLGRADEYGFLWTNSEHADEFVGGYATETESEEFNLERWAADRGLETVPPDFQTDDAFEDYMAWAAKIEEQFFNEYDDVISR